MNFDPGAMGTAGNGTTGSGTAGNGNNPNATDPAQQYPMAYAYSQNPQAAVNAFLSQHQIQPGNHNPYADFLRTLANGVVNPLMQTITVPGANQAGAMDQLSNLPQILANVLMGNGGQAFGNLANWGSNFLHTIQNTPGQQGAGSIAANMSYPELQQALQLVNQFKTIGMNKYLANAYGNAQQQVFDNYDLNSQNQIANHQQLTNPADYLFQNDPWGLFR